MYSPINVNDRLTIAVEKPALGFQSRLIIMS